METVNYHISKLYGNLTSQKENSTNCSQNQGKIPNLQNEMQFQFHFNFIPTYFKLQIPKYELLLSFLKKLFGNYQKEIIYKMVLNQLLLQIKSWVPNLTKA